MCICRKWPEIWRDFLGLSPVFSTITYRYGILRTSLRLYSKKHKSGRYSVTYWTMRGKGEWDQRTTWTTPQLVSCTCCSYGLRYSDTRQVHSKEPRRSTCNNMFCHWRGSMDSDCFTVLYEDIHRTANRERWLDYTCFTGQYWIDRRKLFTNHYRYVSPVIALYVHI